MESRTQDLDPQDWQTLVGTWALDATHPLLPGATSIPVESIGSSRSA